MPAKRFYPWLPLIVIGLLIGTVNNAYFLWFLTTKYDNIFSLDGDWLLVRPAHLMVYLTQTFGGVLIAVMVVMITVGLIGLRSGDPEVHRRSPPEED